MTAVRGAPYVAIAAILVVLGMLLGVVGGDRSIVAALLLLGCLSAVAAVTGADPGRR